MMKKIFFTILILALLGDVFSQRLCGSQLNFTEIQQTDPARYQRIMELESQLQQVRFEAMNNVPTSTIVIPVVVHIVYNTSTQNISDTQVHSQIRILNEDFRRQNPDRVNTPAAFAHLAGDANIEFRLARIDPNGNPTSGITRTRTSVTGFSHTGPNRDNVKFTNRGGRDAWNTQRYLNIWVCRFADERILGYAQFPFDFATSPNTDGIVVCYRSFGIGSNNRPDFNRGRTATHEIGHWLNLRHIWGDNSNCHIDDGVADTPPQSQPTWGCPSFPRLDICAPSNPGVMFMNFMDYSNDACMNMFTNGQIVRMRALFDTQNGIRREMLALSEFITNPPAISGPSILCDIGTFSIDNLPAGATVTWISPSLVCIGSCCVGPGTHCTRPVVNGRSSITMERWPGADGTSSVQANINLNGQLITILPVKQVAVGPPRYISIFGAHENTAICPRDAFEERLYYMGEELREGNSHRITNVEWVGISPGLTPIDGSHPFGVWVAHTQAMSRNVLRIYEFNSANRASVLVRARNQCGWSDFRVITYLRNTHCFSHPGGPGGPGGNPNEPPCQICGPGFCSCIDLPAPCLPRSVPAPFGDGIIAHPNPVSDVLTIDLTQLETFEARTDVRASEVFNVRLLNAHGMIVRQQRTQAATIQFDVSNLPEGTYYLHIEHNGEIEKHQIIVQRN